MWARTHGHGWPGRVEDAGRPASEYKEQRKRANAEDICKGRFWEGRFKSQVIKDEKGLLAAMAYVDLNPIRAGMTNRLDHSHNTSVKERIKHARDNPKLLTATMMPIHGTIKPTTLNIKVKDYFELVDWTG